MNVLGDKENKKIFPSKKLLIPELSGNNLTIVALKEGETQSEYLLRMSDEDQDADAVSTALNP